MYQPFGEFQGSLPVAVPSSSPSHIIDFINSDNMVDEFKQVFLTAIGGFVDSQYGVLSSWVVQWVASKVILGTMARWKAIYLMNGYDKVWSVIQNLRFLTNRSPLPTETLHQDGTLVSENWSARELYAVLIPWI